MPNMSEPVRKSFRASVDAHLLACSAAAVLGGVATANGAVVHSGPLNINLSAVEPLTGTQAYLDLEALTGSGPAPFAAPAGTDMYFYLFVNGFTVASSGDDGVRFIGPEYGIVSRLTPGTTISSANTFDAGGYLTAGYNGYTYGPTQWDGTFTNCFIGFSFDRGQGTQYGWVRLNTEAGTFGPGGQVPIVGTATVVDFAYESVPGASILAGAIPEPASCALGVLALGALARRSKGVATAQEMN